MSEVISALGRFLRQSPPGYAAARHVTDIERPVESDETVIDLRAKIVEDSALVQRDVPSRSGSGLRYFLDGAQRQRTVAYRKGEVSAPIVYGFVGAIILERQGREAGPCDGYFDYDEALYAPLELTPLDEMRSAGIDVRDTGATAAAWGDLARCAQTAISNQRERLERALAHRWLERGHDGWLAIDGALREQVQFQADSCVIGIAKSHRAQFFEGADQAKVFGLKRGQRTSVFSVGGAVFTWYLRLHEPADASPLYGLIRVEAPRYEDGLADEISAWLLNETRPTSHPDARFDRMLYPIRLCEEWIRSRMPSPMAISAGIGASRA